MSVVVLHFILQCSIWSLYRYCFLVHLCMSYLRQASLRDNWHCTSSYHPCDLTVPNYYFEERRCCSLVTCCWPLSSGDLYINIIVRAFLSFVLERARAASKQENKRKKQPAEEVTTSSAGCFFERSHLKSIAIHFIRILFTSKPIHELRLDLNVANTVIALTIRVI